MEVTARNIGAETRAVEEGHRAFVQPEGWVKVVSDTFHDKHYRVDITAHIDGLISFRCRPDGHRCYHEDHLAASAQPGVTPCKHAALAARRLERVGLATFDGLWRSTIAVPQCPHEWEGDACKLCGDPNPLIGLGMRA